MNPIGVRLPLSNSAVWWRRRDGAYLFSDEPKAWLEQHGITRKLLPYGDKTSIHPGPGHFFEAYNYGPVQDGPDAHMFPADSDLHGPTMGWVWFHADDSQTALLFKLTWGGR